MIIQLTLSPEDRVSKPCQITEESRLICNGNTVELSVDDFMKYTVAPYSRTWCASVLNGNRKNSNFLSTQILTLDIDNKPNESILGIGDVLERCREYEIEPTFIYSSFSHSEQIPRFRIIFVLDEQITDSKIAKLALGTLRNIFPESNSITDLSRMWLGGKEILFNNHNYVLPLEKLKFLCCLQEMAKGKNPKRDIQKIEKNWGIMRLPYNSIIEDSPNSTLASKTLYKRKLEKFDWEFAKKESTLLSKFLDYKERICDYDLILLASNMFRIKGGEKKFKNVILQNPYINDNKIGIMQYIKYRWETEERIYPIPFNHIYSENEDDKKVFNNYHTLLQVRPVGQYSKPKIMNNSIPTYQPQEGRDKMKSEFNRIMSEDSNKIYLMKCATGLGKTSIAIDTEGIVLFFPNHDLKDEKSKISNIEHLCTPELIDNLPEHLSIKYANLCKCGLYKDALSELISFIESPQANIYSEATQNITNYLNQINRCKSSEKTIFSTHAKGCITNFENHHTYIFDEDPLHQLARFEKITTKDLRILAKALFDKGNIHDGNLVKRLADHLKNGIGFLMEDMPPINFQNANLIVEVIKLNNDKFSGDVFSFIFNDKSIKYVIEPEDSDDPDGEKVIHYINYRPLLEDKKYIILSATVDAWIYEKLYGDRVELIDLSDVEMKGEIIQFSDKSFSRTAMRLNENRVKKADDFLNKLKVITFLKHKTDFSNTVEQLHFGKSEGFNSLSGKDFKVIGTPHISNCHYLLFGKLLNIPLSTLNLIPKRKLIEHNGFKYNFYTFEHEELRRIQFYFIEKELLQAVGRARLLDHKNTVFIFSEYPLPRARQLCLNEVDHIEKQYLHEAA